MLIEDELFLAENVANILRFEGYSVFSVPSKQGALQALQEQHFDLIICDIRIVGGSGYEVLSIYRSTMKGPPAPFIIITASSERAMMRTAMELGADDFITKPFTRDELINSININLKKRTELLSLIGDAPSDNGSGKEASNDYSVNLVGSVKLGLKDRIVLKIKKVNTNLYVRDILSISSMGDYSVIKPVFGQKFIVRKTLKSWLNSLPEEHFFRIHREHIIHGLYVEAITEDEGNMLLVKMRFSDQQFKVSKRMRTTLNFTAHTVSKK